MKVFPSKDKCSNLRIDDIASKVGWGKEKGIKIPHRNKMKE